MYLLVDPASRNCAVVDPVEPEKVNIARYISCGLLVYKCVVTLMG